MELIINNNIINNYILGARSVKRFASRLAAYLFRRGSSRAKSSGEKKKKKKKKSI